MVYKMSIPFYKPGIWEAGWGGWEESGIRLEIYQECPIDKLFRGDRLKLGILWELFAPMGVYLNA
jgi:hypothetical protein